jgi:hypothetical protein
MVMGLAPLVQQGASSGGWDWRLPRSTRLNTATCDSGNLRLVAGCWRKPLHDACMLVGDGQGGGTLQACRIEFLQDTMTVIVCC